jgi:hypothetical protein
VNNSEEFVAGLDCKCEVCASITMLAHDKPLYDALYEQTQHKCAQYRAYCNQELRHHTNRFCEYEDCDQHPEAGGVLCAGHVEDDARERNERQLRLEGVAL